MAGRSPYPYRPRNDLDRFIEARDLAHREQRRGLIRSVFTSFGPHRWLVVPLATLVIVAFAWFIASLPGAMA